MLNIVVRGQAARILDALARQPGGTWLDVWTELVAIQQERAALAVPPGQIGLHRFTVDNGSAKAVFGINRRPPEKVLIERIDIFPARKSRRKRR
jgi:hypothetical protein